MDSITQIVLGAAVGEAVLGKKVGNKAMLWGAIAGTIPDLDVIVGKFFQPITALEMHRGFSHSIIFALLFSPVFIRFRQTLIIVFSFSFNSLTNFISLVLSR